MRTNAWSDNGLIWSWWRVIPTTPLPSSNRSSRPYPREITKQQSITFRPFWRKIENTFKIECYQRDKFPHQSYSSEKGTTERAKASFYWIKASSDLKKRQCRPLLGPTGQREEARRVTLSKRRPTLIKHSKSGRNIRPFRCLAAILIFNIFIFQFISHNLKIS